jgi:transcriptional regulator GlxA family with amidase domain
MLQGQDGRAVEVLFLLLPRFSMSAYTAAVEPLRLANYSSGQTLYSWRTGTPDGAPVAASNGTRILPDCAARDLSRVENVVVCTGIDAHLIDDPETLGLLRRWAKSGARLGAVCTGAEVLARAGLLAGRRVTIHWENMGAFVERYPALVVRPTLYEVDRDRFTCAGGDAASDMMLTEIADRHGADLAAAVAEQLMHERIRAGDDEQTGPLAARRAVGEPHVLKALREMRAQLEPPLSTAELARRVGLSQRSLERLFRAEIGTTPARHYLRLRLNRARQLLGQTTMPVTEIAIACGFASVSHFARTYGAAFGHSPRAERRGEKTTA